MTAQLKQIVEALLLASDAPLTVVRIQNLFERNAQPSASEVKAALESLQQDCESRGVELRKIGSGYRYQSRAQYADWIRKLHAVRPPRLSRALLETLAIIAYRQPVTRGDIEDIRGVGVTTEIMRRLQEREWIAEVGTRDVPGHPTLFGTTAEFLSYFNLESLSELPPLAQERDYGDIAAELEMPLPPELLAAMQGDESTADESSDSESDDDDGDGDGDDDDDDNDDDNDEENSTSSSESARSESE